MLWIVLPSVALRALAAVDVPVRVSVNVSVKIIFVVDVDVATVPIAITPVTAPRAPSGRTQRNSRAPR
jgi:hypothetical protein